MPDEEVPAFWNEHERHIGTGIAAEAFRHGLVDECVLLCPVIVGGGKPALPRGVRPWTTDDSTTA